VSPYDGQECVVGETNGPTIAPMSEENRISRNYAPCGTEDRMRALAAISLLISGFFIVLGFVFLDEGRHGSSSFITFGGVLLVVMIFSGAVARKQGKI
jgi:hypothetical protein